MPQCFGMRRNVMIVHPAADYPEKLIAVLRGGARDFGIGPGNVFPGKGGMKQREQDAKKERECREEEKMKKRRNDPAAIYP